MTIQKKRFIENLARFLSDNVAAKSIALQIEGGRPPYSTIPKFAESWAQLRTLAGVHGYADVKETTKVLENLLAD